MSILQIYQQYQIPPNLQRHMLEVAAVGQYVCQFWRGSKVNTELIMQGLLLHDMGNILKFKRPFLGELEAQAPHWEQVALKLQQKYGSDVQTATLRIVKELGLEEAYSLLVEMRAAWEEEKDISWEARICEYADCCVTPEGIVGFERRIEDLKNRYLLTEDSQTIQLLRKNGKQVCKNCSAEVMFLENHDFSEQIKDLSEFDFGVSGAGF